MYSSGQSTEFDRFEIKYLGQDDNSPDIEFALKFYAPNNKYVSILSIYLNTSEAMNLSNACKNAVLLKTHNLPDTLAAE